MTTLYATEPEFKMIAGHSVDIPYEVFLADGSPVDLVIPNVRINWQLSPYEMQTVPVIEKTNTQASAIKIDQKQLNSFTVHLASTDTENLSGLFLYQLSITDPGNFTSKPLEGTILIRKRIHGGDTI